MTLAQAEERLAAVRAAILSAIKKGGTTSYSIGSKSRTVDLKWLTQEEQRLEVVVASYQSGGWFAGQFRPPE